MCVHLYVDFFNTSIGNLGGGFVTIKKLADESYCFLNNIFFSLAYFIIKIKYIIIITYKIYVNVLSYDINKAFSQQWTIRKILEPWLVWLSGLSTGLQSKRSLV